MLRPSPASFSVSKHTICMVDDSLIAEKREQRKALLRALYGLVDGREGFTIPPMQYFALGSQVGLDRDVTGQTVRFLVSEGLLEYKPASEAVSLTHKGVLEAERQSAETRQDGGQVPDTKIKALAARILMVLRAKSRK